MDDDSDSIDGYVVLVFIIGNPWYVGLSVSIICRAVIWPNPTMLKIKPQDPVAPSLVKDNLGPVAPNAVKDNLGLSLSLTKGWAKLCCTSASHIQTYG